MTPESLGSLLARARACRVCAAALPLGPRPVLRAAETAQLLIIGQAPGTKVHASGVPWDDRSGDVLRGWLGLDRAAFYDESRIAIIPMGLCYPGRAASGGDAPPRPECAPLWQGPLRAALPAIGLTLLVGSHAQKWHLGHRAKPTMTETVAAWQHTAAEGLFPLPHPSWRNTGWRKRHPWFEAEVVPALRRRCASLWAACR